MRCLLPRDSLALIPRLSMLRPTSRVVALASLRWMRWLRIAQLRTVLSVLFVPFVVSVVFVLFVVSALAPLRWLAPLASLYSSYALSFDPFRVGIWGMLYLGIRSAHPEGHGCAI